MGAGRLEYYTHPGRLEYYTHPGRLVLTVIPTREASSHRYTHHGG